MLEKYKQNDGWVKLTASIDKQLVVARNLISQIHAQTDLIKAKTTAKQDASSVRSRLNNLEKSYKSVNSDVSKMEKQRGLIEAEIRLRESNKK